MWKNVLLCVMSTALACVMCTGIAVCFDFSIEDAAKAAAVGTPIVCVCFIGLVYIILGLEEDGLDAIDIVIICCSMLFGSPLGMLILTRSTPTENWIESILGTITLIIALQISCLFFFCCAYLLRRN
jgi:uncharacterized membrane protein YfcA